jgi:hypothetical protein
VAPGEHTDFGSVTVLFNHMGGLQVLNPDSKEWKYVKPEPGCAVINLGDAIVKPGIQSCTAACIGLLVRRANKLSCHGIRSCTSPDPMGTLFSGRF